jgi:stringent starvation protein B
MKNLETPAYKELMKEHIYATVEYMFDKNQEFGVACETINVNFEPNLPTELRESLPEVTLFMLANYSFETANIDTDYISFEAGFGSENFGALVHIPLLAVKQIFVDEYPILINVADINESVKEEDKEPIDSMAALLNNPENAKLLKKK